MDGDVARKFFRSFDGVVPISIGSFSISDVVRT